MLKICTVYFDGFYTPDYVSKLYRSLKRNTSVPFEFVCLSDTNDIEADVILPYNHHDKIKKHWHKLKYFSPQFAYQNPGDDIIVMDIDQIVVGNVDELLSWPVEERELLTYGQWWNVKLPINGGFYKFKSGSLKEVWDNFIQGANFWQNHYYETGRVSTKYYGEQNYVYNQTKENNIKISLTPEKWLCKYTNDFRENVKLNKTYREKFNAEYMILDETHPNIKMVHIAGVGKTIHEIDEQFIKDNWK